MLNENMMVTGIYSTLMMMKAGKAGPIKGPTLVMRDKITAAATENEKMPEFISK